MAKNIILFDNDKEKTRRLDMAEKLLKKCLEEKVTISANFFDSLVYIFTESQQWRSLINMLSNINQSNSTPEVKTLNYLKKNLLYCFEP